MTSIGISMTGYNESHLFSRYPIITMTDVHVKCRVRSGLIIKSLSHANQIRFMRYQRCRYVVVISITHIHIVIFYECKMFSVTPCHRSFANRNFFPKNSFLRYREAPVVFIDHRASKMDIRSDANIRERARVKRTWEKFISRRSRRCRYDTMSREFGFTRRRTWRKAVFGRAVAIAQSKFRVSLKACNCYPSPRDYR